jgi:hypothetical protein
MTHQSALLNFIHDELDKPNLATDLEKKLQDVRASAEEKIRLLISAN